MRISDWASLSADYAACHTTRGNRVCHAVGIPLIALAVVCWTQWPAGNRVPLLLTLWPVYLLWDFRLALGMLACLAALAAVGPLLPWWGPAGAFTLGWMFQLAGHRFFEGRSPAFTRNLIHLLVGPAWLLREAFKAAP